MVNIICNDSGVGGLLNSGATWANNYWSSSGGGDGTACFQNFNSGSQDYYGKGDGSLSVRPVRAFLIIYLFTHSSI